MPGLITDKLDQVSSSNTGRPVVALLASPGHTSGGTTINLNDSTNWTTNSAVHFVIYTTQTIGNTTVKDPTSQTDWKGTLSGTVISNMTITGGIDRDYSAGAIVEITPTARYAKDLYDWAIAEHAQNGTHTNVTATTLNVSGATVLDDVTINGDLEITGVGASSWSPLGDTPTTVTHNGNRSYTMVFNGNDVTDTISPGMRLRTQRTVAAPTQCTSLNGTNQYYSKTSPSGMTFTDDFTVSAWVKLSSYAIGDIVSRYNGTSGWSFGVLDTGQVILRCYNAGQESNISTYQSIPLNKWVHLVAQIDISTYTATATTSYVLIDGVEVPIALNRSSAITTLVQAGNLEVGSRNGGTIPFPGKIAQVAIFSAKVTQATIRASMNQGLTGSETSLVSAYSFNNSINDLSSNANNLTANGGALATNADSPFGGQSNGTISSTLDYAIVTKTDFSTNSTVVVQVPEGCTIPTSGGITTVTYSDRKVPFGMPVERGRWEVKTSIRTLGQQAAPVQNTWYNINSGQISVPAGGWLLSYQAAAQVDKAGGSDITLQTTLSTANNSESDSELTSFFEGSTATIIAGNAHRAKPVTTTSQTSYYFNTRTSVASMSNIYNRGDLAPITLTAECAYL